MHSKNPPNRQERQSTAERIEAWVREKKWVLPTPTVYEVGSSPSPPSGHTSSPQIEHVLQSTLEASLTCATQPLSQSNLPSSNDLKGLSTQPRLGVLVFGSATRPGGGWRSGAKAQEEDVSLHSTWGLQAEKAPPGFYMPNKGLGPHAILQANGWWLEDEYGFALNSPVPCSFVSIAAPNRKIPDVAQTPYQELQQMVYERLMLALSVWNKQNIDTVVLGALGCGVFEWAPDQMAKVFAKALTDTSFQGKVVMAFVDPHVKHIFEQTMNSVQARPQPSMRL